MPNKYILPLGILVAFIGLENLPIPHPTNSGSNHFTKEQREEMSAKNCFKMGTYSYRVGDRGMKNFYYPDSRRVMDYVVGRRHSSGVKLERYAAIRIKSQRKVNRTHNRHLRKNALINYVITRKNMLMVVHRFYGDKGLDWMLDNYDSATDKAIVEEIEAVFLSNKNIDKTIPLAQDIILLVNDFHDFIPCLAKINREKS